MALERNVGKRPGDTKNLIERLYITSMESLVEARQHGSCGLPCLTMALRKESLKVRRPWFCHVRVFCPLSFGILPLNPFAADGAIGHISCRI
jgi:hypothetical protein